MNTRTLALISLLSSFAHAQTYQKPGLGNVTTVGLTFHPAAAAAGATGATGEAVTWR